MATNGREARRRRIVERGADRLALITGRIQTLPPSESPELHHSRSGACPPSTTQDADLSTLHPSHRPIVPDDSEDKSPSSLLQLESATETGEINAIGDGTRVQPAVGKSQTSAEVPRAPLEADGKVQSSQVFPGVLESSISPSRTEYQFEPQVHRGEIFTPRQISSAVAASESTRICCSLGAAFLVVLSYVGSPILGSPVGKSTLFFRPLYLVLLTNISIVLARLLFGKQRGSKKAVQGTNNTPLTGGSGLAEQVGKTLEFGLLLQNIINAVFMDCSVYAIVVVCGLSMARKLGW